MKIELAKTEATKLFLTSCREPNVYSTTKIKSCPGLFKRALVNYYGRIEDIYKKVMDENYVTYKLKEWYCYQDGIKVIIVNKNFGALYTGSVVYGFKIEDDNDESTRQEMDLQKYYLKGKSYVKRNPNTIFELNFGTHGVKLRGVWSGFRSQYKDMSQKEVWTKNLETLQRVRGEFGFGPEFVDGYSKAINEYLATL